MDDGARDSIELEDLALRHEALRQRAELTPANDAAAVLELGSAVLLHRAVQVARSVTLLSWLDPAVVARIGEEQERLGEDLELLHELLESEAASEDARVLAEALRRRLQDCLQHDARVLQRPLQRLLGLWSAAGAPAHSPPAALDPRREE